MQSLRNTYHKQANNKQTTNKQTHKQTNKQTNKQHKQTTQTNNTNKTNKQTQTTNNKHKHKHKHTNKHKQTHNTPSIKHPFQNITCIDDEADFTVVCFDWFLGGLYSDKWLSLCFSDEARPTRRRWVVFINVYFTLRFCFVYVYVSVSVSVSVSVLFCFVLCFCFCLSDPTSRHISSYSS